MRDCRGGEPWNHIGMTERPYERLLGITALSARDVRLLDD